MDLKGKTILLVEDEAIIALTEIRWLKSEGFNVIHVTGGTEAIKTIREKTASVDLILMDIDLGDGIDGTEASREILKDHDIPLLFLSSHTEKEIVSKTEEITSYGYVVKGSDKTVLIASIRMAFKLHCSKQELLKKEEALRSSRQMLQFVLEANNEGVWTVNLKTNEYTLSPRGCEILGYGHDELHHKVKLWPELVYEEDIPGTLEQLQIYLTKRSEIFRAEQRLKTKSGELIWVLSRGTLLSDDNDGTPLQMIGTHIDITENKLREIRLKEYADELKASNAVKDKYFSIISHDLRGPFQGFLGLTRELTENIADMDKQEISEIASVMNHSAEKTYELLTNLLEWSRLKTGRFEFNPLELNLFSEAENIRKLFLSSASHKSISIVNNIDKHLFIHTDKNALSTILRNLVDNAIKFTPAGGSVSISSEPKGDFVQVSVADSGIGISSECLDKILLADSGFTTRGTSGEKGSGLGLALCRDLIKKCKVEIEITSTANHGTVIKFTLPFLTNPILSHPSS